VSDKKDLDEAVRNLRSQIGTLDVDDEQTRRRLRGLVEEIETALGSSEGARAHEKLGERLKDSVLQFEVSHPRIAAVLDELIDKLSKMGI